MFHLARPDIEKVHEISIDDHSYTCRVGSVALECAVMDLHNGTGAGINSSALEVACSAPGHRGKFRKFLLTIIHPLTPSATVLLSNMLV
jgi:hypothetical protein